MDRIALDQDENRIQIEGDPIHGNNEPEEPPELFSGEDAHQANRDRGLAGGKGSNRKRLSDDFGLDHLPVLMCAQRFGVLAVSMAT